MQYTVISPGPNGQKTPPGGWSVFIPEIPADQKRVFTHKMKHLLTNIVTVAMRKAGVSIPNLEERIHRHTATRLLREGHDEWVSGVQHRKRTIAEHWRGTQAFLRVKAREAAGKPVLTTQAEAERRAAVCAAGDGGLPCDKNVLNKSSKLEKIEDEKMAGMVSGRTTEHDGMLGTCSVCSCRLQTIVHCLPDVLLIDKVTPAEWKKYPAFCWKRELQTP